MLKLLICIPTESVGAYFSGNTILNKIPVQTPFFRVQRYGNGGGMAKKWHCFKKKKWLKMLNCGAKEIRCAANCLAKVKRPF
jgi:hypothetical protein